MHATDLQINQLLGIRLAPAGADHLLELAEAPLTHNHIGTIHATAQFALAEAASGEYLLGALGAHQSEVVGILRRAEIKFSRPANGVLRAWARFARPQDTEVFTNLTESGRATVAVHVEIKDATGALTMRSRHEWFVQRRGIGTSTPHADSAD